MIQQRTGHRSLKALQTYERVTHDQELAVSRILTSHSKTDYSEALSNQHSTSADDKMDPLSVQTKSFVTSSDTKVEPLSFENKSFGSNLSWLFGSTTNCVINVSFGQGSNTSVAFHAKHEFDYDFPEEIDKAMLSMDL